MKERRRIQVSEIRIEGENYKLAYQVLREHSLYEGVKVWVVELSGELVVPRTLSPNEVKAKLKEEVMRRKKEIEEIEKLRNEVGLIEL